MTTHPAILQAREFHAKGDYKGALDKITLALINDPSNRDLLYTRAHLSLANENVPQAEQDLDKIISLYPQDSEAWDDRGVIFQWQKNYMEAAQHHLKAAELQVRDGYLLNLAIALSHLGQKAQAEKLYGDILMINPKNTRAMVNLGIACDDHGEFNKAESYFAQAHEAGDTSFELCMAYGNVCRHLDRAAEAIEWYQKALLDKPNHPSAQFLLAALKGENPDAPPASHISELFDSYADHFDNNLVGTLNYRGPELLLTAVKSELEKRQNEKGELTGLDLGAGTGLFGKLLRPYLKTSIGLDLSARMLAKAQEQKIYDQIICTDITKGMTSFPDQSFDLISAADVFVYSGKLEDIFSAINRTLKPGGLFVYSVEAMLDN